MRKLTDWLENFKKYEAKIINMGNKNREITAKLEQLKQQLRERKRESWEKERN